MSQTVIETKSQFRHLGFTIDTGLSFNSHVEIVKKNMNNFCGTIYQLPTTLSSSQMIQVLKTHVQPVIQNGVLIYGSMYITRLKYLDQTIRKLHRTIIHKKQSLTECYHLYSATDLLLYELFQTLNKVISTENSVYIY